MENNNIHKGLTINGYKWNYYDDKTKLHTFSKKVNNPYGYNVIKCLPSDIENSNINDMCKMELSRNETYYKDIMKVRRTLKNELQEGILVYETNKTPELFSELQEIEKDLKDIKLQLKGCQ
jgi:hypothetical protein